MILPFLYLLNVVLLTRLPLLLRDDRVRPRSMVVAGLLQLAALTVFVWNRGVALAGVAIICLGVIGWYVERPEQGLLPARRLLILALYFLVFSVLCSPFLGLRFRDALAGVGGNAAEYFLPAKCLGTVQWRSFHAQLLGVLLSLNEANLLIRWVIEKFIYRPAQTGDAAAPPLTLRKKEYDRGRLIGLLERLLVFFFVVQNQFMALGYVVAAKGIARFKELENRDFADYFLIGTMLSIVTAGVVALLVKNLLLS